MTDGVLVNEIYLSLQGESTFAGLPCILVRLTGCNLRCSYCDSAYAFAAGTRKTLDETVAEVLQIARPHRRLTADGPLPLVELTGGEPLLQPGSLGLMTRFCDEGLTVLVETSGAVDIALVDPRVHRIMDLKCPSSGEMGRNRFENLKLLKSRDELKFVIGTEEDYLWAKQQIEEHRLAQLCPILFSWVTPLALDQQHPSLKEVPPGQQSITRQQLAERILSDALPVRFQLQQHKFIWPPTQRGV